MFLNFAMLHFLNPHLRTFRGTEAFAFMGSALQQMTAAAIPLSLAQVYRCVCVCHARKLIVSLPGYISPAGRQDGHHNGN